MGLVIPWWLVLPFFLTLLFCYTQSLIKAYIAPFTRRTFIYWCITCILASILVSAWTLFGFPLPVFYSFIYVLYAVHIILNEWKSTKAWFFLNLSYANLLTLHLIIVGVNALINGTTMYAFLASPLGRNVSICALLCVCILEDVHFLTYHKLSDVLLVNSDSEEAKPFMAFLWFCVVYLLIDSTLCVFELEPLYPPLFLVGSNVVVMFTLVRFLLHISALVKEHYLKAEHDRLASMLEATEETVEILNQLAQKDNLTGVYSRLFAMEHIDALLVNETPFALVFIDLDALKQINDSRGHDAGDAYLIGFVAALEAHLRSCDILARVGGDEFIVLMPGCTLDIAEERFNTIRAHLENGPSATKAYHFSYGASAYSSGTTDAKSLLSEADNAMYRDKTRRHTQGGSPA